MRDRSFGIRSGLAATGLAVGVLAAGSGIVAGVDGTGTRTESAAQGGAGGADGSSPSPAPTPVDISTYLTATLAALNGAETPVSVTIDLFDPDAGAVQETGLVIPLGPLDTLSQRVIEATYVLTFAGDGRTPVSCMVTMAAGTERDFLVLADRVLVIDPAATAVTAADLDVATSSLCG